MAIKCCHGCVPPKRTDTCHTTCPDYVIEAAFHNADREVRNVEKQVRSDIYNARAAHVERALKNRRK